MGRYRRKDLSWKANQSTGIEHEIGRRKGPRAGPIRGGSSMRSPSAWTWKAPCLVFRAKILRFPYSSSSHTPRGSAGPWRLGRW